MSINGTSSTWLTAKALLNTLLHQLLAVIIVYGIWGPLLIGDKASWHAVLCTIGVYLIVESLILIGSDNVYTPEYENKKTLFTIHGICALVGIIFIICGIVLEIIREIDEDISHFSTVHGIIALITLILIIISLFLGICARFSKALRGFVKPVLQIVTHNIVGIITYMFLIASLCSGFYTDSFISPWETQLAATIVACLVCLWSLKHSFISLKRQFDIIR